MTIESRMHSAKALLENPLLNEIFDKSRDNAIAAWLATPTSDRDQRDWCWVLIKAQDALKATLQAVIDDGLIAADRLTDTPQP